MSYHCINVLNGTCPEKKIGSNKTCDEYNSIAINDAIRNNNTIDVNTLLTNNTRKCSYDLVYRWVSVIE